MHHLTHVSLRVGSPSQRAGADPPTQQLRREWMSEEDERTSCSALFRSRREHCIITPTNTDSDVNVMAFHVED